MPPRHTEEEQADFAKALVSIAEQGALSQEEVDTLSVLDGADLDRFRGSVGGASRRAPERA